MAATFRFSLVSPERELLSEEVEQVVVPGTEGEFTVLPRHAPLMTTIEPGVVRVLVRGTDERRIAVFGGFAEVGPEGLSILAEQAIPVAELDAETVDRRIGEAEEALGAARDDDARYRVQTRIAQLRSLRSAALAG